MTGVVVIGAGPGLGAAVASRFASEGLPVSLIARSRANLRAAHRALDRQAVDVTGYLAGLADQGALRRALDDVIARFGVPEALVYQASPDWPRRTKGLSVADVMQLWASSLGGAVTAASEVLPLMVKRGSGSMFLTSGVQKTSPTVSLSPSDDRLRSLADTLASECAPAGVHVASVMIRGRVTPGTNFDSEQIAEYYWRIHQERPEGWRSRYNYTGAYEEEEAATVGDCSGGTQLTHLTPCC